MHSDVDVSSLGSGAVLSFHRVDASVVSISITNKQAAGSNARGDLNVDHDPLVDFFAIFVPDDLGDWPSGDAAAELNVLSGPQGQLLVWRPLDLRRNCRKGQESTRQDSKG